MKHSSFDPKNGSCSDGTVSDDVSWKKRLSISATPDRPRPGVTAVVVPQPFPFADGPNPASVHEISKRESVPRRRR